MMPSTRNCIDNYKKVVHAYKHRRRLTVYVYGRSEDLDNGWYHHYPDFKVDILTDRVEILYHKEGDFEEEW